jgi:opacity protein-like surface antigen
VVRALTVFLICAPAFGQFSFGVIGGIPFNDLSNGFSSNALKLADSSGHYTIGPTVTLSLPLRFRLEVDALYRPMSVDVTMGTANPSNSSGSEWRIPVLLQYRLRTPLLKPFVEGGYSYDHVSLTPEALSAIVTGSASRNGFVLGAGLDFKVPFLRISPELRYTHTTNPNSTNLLNNNQTEVLLGIRF